MKKSEGLQAIEKPLASLPYAIGKHILDHIQKLTHYEPVIDAKAKKIRQQMTPKVVMVMSDNCVNKQQQAALAAKRSEEDRKLQQWVAQQSLTELCRRTGNC
ncbi:hypothetical protein [Pantoea agglomerans]|jgi:alpha-D-ribose 1-methylphosphonate 5-triphosphate synthase subunit PhnI|uniref:hypothetical protein n=1 Tax=Enterobacter agglomerans TaxID=549 RepID=UPI0005E5564E|nr:hypothetical protein [Pantoea agglomerans]KJH63224.1 hypothetical protein UF13_04860 [Pantoea agglomerans]